LNFVIQTMLLTELPLFTRDSLKSLIRLVCLLAVQHFCNLRETWTWSWKPRRCILLLVDVTHLAIVPFHLFTVLVWSAKYNRSRKRTRRLPNYNSERSAFLRAAVHKNAEVGAGVYIYTGFVGWLRIISIRAILHGIRSASEPTFFIPGSTMSNPRNDVYLNTSN